LSNKTFQWLWFKILSKFYPRKTGDGSSLWDYKPYMVGYLTWGKRLANLQACIIGDSNGEELKDYESMRRLKEPTVNIAIGGTRADQWMEFIKNDSKIKTLLSGLKIISNVGGNNILQDQFDKLEPSVKWLSEFFGDRYYPVTIPYIWAELISKLTGKNENIITNQIHQANYIILQNCKFDNIINITYFTGQNDMPYWFTHKDLVHYSDEFDYRIRIPLINKVVYD